MLMAGVVSRGAADVAVDRDLLCRGPPPHIRIVALPEHLTPEHAVERSLVVLIDVQRMTTTLTTALAEGASQVRVFREVDEVHDAAREYGVYKQRGVLAEMMGGLSPATGCWLGGERHGQQIPGFDGDNSPWSYIGKDVLGGKTLLFTTTNGSKAAQFVKCADKLVLGSFVNLSAVRAEILRRGGPVLLVCSGTSGERSDEDEIFAGVLAIQVLQALTMDTGDSAEFPVQGELGDAISIEIVRRAATLMGKGVRGPSG
jgi:phosphosulfolactate phosphohydrolase-like enzyme